MNFAGAASAPWAWPGRIRKAGGGLQAGCPSSIRRVCRPKQPSQADAELPQELHPAHALSLVIAQLTGARTPWKRRKARRPLFPTSSKWIGRAFGVVRYPKMIWCDSLSAIMALEAVSEGLLTASEAV
jgi:hypothetical protein